MYYLRSFMSFHPATVLLSWLLTVALLMRSGLIGNTLTAALIVLLAALLDHHGLVQQLKRMRWLFLATLISFSLTTPGEVVAHLPWISYEGLHAAMIHGGSLLMMIALLVLLLRKLKTNELVTGLYVLAAPMGLLGFDRKRLAVRLTMTITHLSQSTRQKPQANLAETGTRSLSAISGTPDFLLPDNLAVRLANFPGSLRWNDCLLLLVSVIATARFFLQTSAAL